MKIKTILVIGLLAATSFSVNAQGGACMNPGAMRNCATGSMQCIAQGPGGNCYVGCASLTDINAAIDATTDAKNRCMSIGGLPMAQCQILSCNRV